MTDARQQELFDRAEINDLISAYAQGADNPDLELHFSVYAPDIVLELDGLAPMHGVDDIRKAFADGRMSKLSRCKTQVCTHAMFNRLIDIDGDEATGVVHAVSYVIGTREGAPYAATRGLLYRDRYRRIGGKWLITHRKHSLRWLIEGAPSPLQATA
jgi:ketosteroid isomerase-like protein